MTLGSEYLAGKTAEELRWKQNGRKVSVNTVYRHLRAAGVAIRVPGAKPGPAARARRSFNALVRELQADLRTETWPNGARLADLVDYYGEDELTISKVVAVLFREGRLRVL